MSFGGFWQREKRKQKTFGVTTTKINLELSLGALL